MNVLSVSPEAWTVILTAALAFFTALLVIVGLLQFRVMAKAAKDSADAAQKSADAAQESANAATETVKVMKRTARRQLRARVFVSQAVRVGSPFPGSLKAEIAIKNFGGVPAYNCTYRAEMFYRPSASLDDIPKINKRADDPNLVLPPGAEVKKIVQLPEGTFTDRQDQLVTAGTYSILVHGVIEYRNGFKQDRRSEFLMRSTGADYVAGRFTFCENGNVAN